jgi:hypothetical protein
VSAVGELRVEIVAGGRPDAETVAAIGLAVRAVLAGRGPVGAGRDGAGTPAWRRAALREGVGGAPERRPDGRG